MRGPTGNNELTAKQSRFAELYDGNGTAAARKAGYTGSDNVLAKSAYEKQTDYKLFGRFVPGPGYELCRNLFERSKRLIARYNESADAGEYPPDTEWDAWVKSVEKI